MNIRINNFITENVINKPLNINVIISELLKLTIRVTYFDSGGLGCTVFVLQF